MAAQVLAAVQFVTAVAVAHQMGHDNVSQDDGAGLDRVS